ncbi:MAG: chemotaxis protein CheW [Fimbriiglobus sp.]|jgi:chemotaxis-related protein WspD|nr:chemotaxis protein CheW [Fimbriiglobus sp.]
MIATNRPLSVVAPNDPCWTRIGVWGDRTCPQLADVTHCHNCPVFAAAGRRFLDAPSPPDYLGEWTTRLAAPEHAGATDAQSVLVFRLGREWLALPVGVLVEVTRDRPPHRVPHRGGLLAGVVNIRGELHLAARLDRLLGVAASDTAATHPRMVVARRGSEVWVFAVDEVDQVFHIPAEAIATAPPTLARAAARVTRGVFRSNGRAVGLLDDTRLFQALREQVR